jgi:hypothetical protein
MSTKLNKTVFDTNKFNKVVDTQFTQLVSQPDETFFDVNLATIEDFFTLYDKFFFEIPKEGSTNSHSFIVKESGEYINVDQSNEEIQALLDEIANLRNENLELRQQNVELSKSLNPKETVQSISAPLPPPENFS